MLLRNRMLDHWYEFRPTLVRDLERSGELAAVVAALEQTILEKQAVMLKKGLSLEEIADPGKALARWLRQGEAGVPVPRRFSPVH